MKTVTLCVKGLHCASCKILIEDILNEQTDIKNANVNLKQETVTFETNLNYDEQKFAETLSEVIKPHHYSFSVTKENTTKNTDNSFWPALLIGLIVLTLFFSLQKSGLLNFGLGSTITPLTSFIIGLVASVSSCLAIVGGLVLSLSATVSQDDISDTKPMFLFHTGRLIGFAILGGVLGAVGGAIGVNLTFGVILGLIAALIMIVLGLNLIGVLKKNFITLPENFFNFFRQAESSAVAPLLLGVGTFFLPCGFTQSMQATALSSGSFLSGTFIMLAFALGTLPMLALLSFGSASIATSKYRPLFFKSAGVVVIGLGAFALLSGLIALGIIAPIFNI